MRTLSALVLFILVPSLAIGGPGNTVPPPTTLSDLRVLREKKVGDYFTNPSDSVRSKERLRKDLDFVRREGQAVGVFESTPAFETWWRKNDLTDEQIRQLDTASVTRAASLLYLRYAADHAKEIDLADGAVRKPGTPTKGDADFAEKVDSTERTSIGQWFIKGSTWVGLGALAAGAVILKKIDDVFFFGTLTQLTNTAFEPFIRPIRERIDQLSNTHLAPRTIRYAQAVNGENRRRKKALKQAEKGETLTGAAKRYEHPAISVEDFAEDHAIFYNEFMQADFRWRGWLGNEYIRARNTGFDLLYSQWTSLAERISAYEANANNIVVRIAAVSRPELVAAGATAEELDRFTAALVRKQEILVFVSLTSPEISNLDGKLTTIIHDWQDRGISRAKILDLYQLTIDGFVAKTRPAFALVAMLDNERYFQENNLALKGLDKIQAWQEQAREMVGYYEALQKYADPIESFYKRKGLRYSLQARIAERGYPLGGAPRPVGTIGVKSCKDLFKPVP